MGLAVPLAGHLSGKHTVTLSDRNMSFPSLCKLLLCFREAVKTQKVTFHFTFTGWQQHELAFSHLHYLSCILSCGCTCEKGSPLIFQKISAYHLTNLSPQGGLSSPTHLSVMTGHTPVSVPFPCLQCTGGDLGSPGQTGLWVILPTTSETRWQLPTTKCRLAGSLYRDKSLSSGL